MKDNLTPAQKKRYLKKPFICPYCTSYLIQGGTYSSDVSGNVFQNLTCNTCKKSWKDVYTKKSGEDVYTLSDIKEYK